MNRRFLWTIVVVLLGQSSATAQFGMGGMGGFGFFAPYVSPTQMVQDRRPITQNVGGPVSRPVQKTNAYWSNLREPLPAGYSFTPRSDIRRGSRSIDVASTRRVSNAEPNARTSPNQTFLGFFGADQRVVWPKDAPLEGEFSGKRSAVDTALAELRKEVASDKSPSVAVVVNSRNELLAYGRPALAALREGQPTQADDFHAWLLGLYNAIGKLVQQ
jgi:hypothetical protein